MKRRCTDMQAIQNMCDERGGVSVLSGSKQLDLDMLTQDLHIIGWVCE